MREESPRMKPPRFSKSVCTNACAWEQDFSARNNTAQGCEEQKELDETASPSTSPSKNRQHVPNEVWRHDDPPVVKQTVQNPVYDEFRAIVRAGRLGKYFKIKPQYLHMQLRDLKRGMDEGDEDAADAFWTFVFGCWFWKSVSFGKANKTNADAINSKEMKKQGWVRNLKKRKFHVKAFLHIMAMSMFSSLTNFSNTSH